MQLVNYLLDPPFAIPNYSANVVKQILRGLEPPEAIVENEHFKRATHQVLYFAGNAEGRD